MSLNVLVFDAMPPVQFLTKMLADSGANIYEITNDGKLELTIKAFHYKVTKNY